MDARVLVIMLWSVCFLPLSYSPSLCCTHTHPHRCHRWLIETYIIMMYARPWFLSQKLIERWHQRHFSIGGEAISAHSHSLARNKCTLRREKQWKCNYRGVKKGLFTCFLGGLKADFDFINTGLQYLNVKQKFGEQCRMQEGGWWLKERTLRGGGGDWGGDRLTGLNDRPSRKTNRWREKE